MKKMICLLISLAFLFNVEAQLQGRWKGNVYHEPLALVRPDSIKLELNVSGNLVTGSSHLFYQRGKRELFELYDLNGQISDSGRTLTLTESLQKVRMGARRSVSGVYELKLSRNSNGYELRGIVQLKSLLTRHRIPVFFQKLPDTIKTAPAPVAAVNFLQRKVVAQGQIPVPVALKNEPLRISLFDNGEVDGDSVSVYYNGRLVLEKVLLSSRPQIIDLPLDSTGQHTLVMVAHNLGRLPPNTGLLVVTLSNGSRYELTFSGDEQTNSSVQLLLQP